MFLESPSQAKRLAALSALPARPVATLPSPLVCRLSARVPSRRSLSSRRAVEEVRPDRASALFSVCWRAQASTPDTRATLEDTRRDGQHGRASGQKRRWGERGSRQARPSPALLRPASPVQFQNSERARGPREQTANQGRPQWPHEARDHFATDQWFLTCHPRLVHRYEFRPPPAPSLASPPS